MTDKTQTFDDCLRKALDWYHEPDKLGKESPLASVYFLGEAIREQEKRITLKRRGNILRDQLYDAAVSMWGDTLPDSCETLESIAREVMEKKGTNHPVYFFWILELRYFRHYYVRDGYPTGNLHKYVGVGKGSFFEHIKRAIAALSWRFLKNSRPTYRLESPANRVKLMGRYLLKQQIISALQEKQSVAICGAGGMGKTTLGVAIQNTWGSHYQFWYTIRPQINDTLLSILFSIGHFLNQHGTSQLWLHLLATTDANVDYSLILGLLHDDLNKMQHKPLLFCFDEIGLIHPTDSEQTTKEHIKILEFFDGLRRSVPLLLIGQSIPIDVDSVHLLQGLTVEDSIKLLKQMGHTIDETSVSKIWALTSGNPRLLTFLATLLNEGVTIAEIEDMSTQSPGMMGWWQRLKRHLSTAEQRLIKQLAVFEIASPKDVWQGEETSLEKLKLRQFVQQDTTNGVSLLPFVRQQTLSEMSKEEMDNAHYQAALVWVKRGEFTQSAHHLQQAGRERDAVELWWTYRDLEIARGKAPIARHIFNRISSNRLKGTYRQYLKVIKGRLNLMIGETEQVLTLPIEKSDHPTDAEAQFYEIYGEAHFMSGDLEQAVTFYDQSLATYARLTREMINVRVRKANTHMRIADNAQAHEETIRAEQAAAYLRALLENERGNFMEAYQSLNVSLNHAMHLKDEQLLAQTHHQLARNLGYCGQLDEAKHHADLAVKYYGEIGDVRRKHVALGGWGAACMDNGRYEEAIPLFETCLSFFRMIDHQFNIASTLVSLAECYFKVGKLEQSRQSAFDVLRMESRYQQPYAYYTLGLIYSETKEIENGIVSFEHGIEQAKLNEDSRLLAYLFHSLGELLLQNGQSDEAMSRLNQSLTLFEQMGIDSEVAKVKQTLAN